MSPQFDSYSFDFILPQTGATKVNSYAVTANFALIRIKCATALVIVPAAKMRKNAPL